MLLGEIMTWEFLVNLITLLMQLDTDINNNTILILTLTFEIIENQNVFLSNFSSIEMILVD